MAAYTQTYTFSNGTTADGGQVNTEIVALGNSVNNIVNAQIGSSAAIATSKLELSAGATVPIVTNNNIGYRSKDSGGTQRDLLIVDTSSNVVSYQNINLSMVEGAHEETVGPINVGTLNAGIGSAQQTMTFRRAYATTNYIITTGAASSEGNPIICHARVLNTTSLTFYVTNIHSAQQTNCTGYVRVIGV